MAICDAVAVCNTVLLLLLFAIQQFDLRERERLAVLEVGCERVEAVVAVGDGGHGVVVLCGVVFVETGSLSGKWGLSVIGGLTPLPETRVNRYVYSSGRIGGHRISIYILAPIRRALLRHYPGLDFAVNHVDTLTLLSE